ncbi:MAG: PilN domain-containing protein [Pseudomonadales bacterium]|jgi:type IV pilus assembly protein PilN|nr:PilN domain-containing protein [Pseudomonadales bacterium]MCP5322203.1 PilN domain-containing protein [Pseudomonadales bacterium]MCP5337089.1 PilN domain-containing protein [Pseudomonadales bacterium]
MAKINLLPWREQRRERLRKEFLAVLGAVVAVGVLVAVLGHIVIDGRITHQNERNEYLRSHIRELDKQVAEIKDLHTRRNQLLDRMKVIQDLQGTRPLIVHIFDEIVRTLPDGVFFRGMERKGQTITIRGTAESNNRVSSLMRRLDASEWFSAPALKAVTANPRFGDQANDFELTVQVSTPGAAKGEGQGETGE